MQQMATVRNARVDSDIPAATSRTEVFRDIGPFGTRPTSNMIFGIYNTVSADPDNTTPNAFHTAVTPYCPTGNCDILPFRTLAVCSQCIDVSHLLSMREEKRSCDSSSIASFFLPNGVHLNRTITSSSLVSTGTGTKPRPGIKNYGESVLLNRSIISISQEAPSSSATANHCSLYWCINTYSTSVKDNKVKETLLDTYHDAGARYYLGHLDLLLPAKGNSSASIFTVEDDASKPLTQWLVDKLQFNNTPPVWCSPRGTSMLEKSKETEFVQVLLNASIPDSFSKIAAGITKHVRSETSKFQESAIGSSGIEWNYSPLEPARGTSWTVQTQLHVRWAWITLPVVLAILTMIFLLMTALQSRKRGLDVWKSSTIPLLYSGLNPGIQRELRAVVDPMQTEGLACRVRVWLLKPENTSETWRLDAMDSMKRSNDVWHEISTST